MTPLNHRVHRAALVGLVSVSVLGSMAWPLYGAAVGSPAGRLEKGQWAFGVDADGWGRELSLGGETQDARVITGSHFRGYGLTEWLSLFARVGGAHMHVTDPGVTTRDATDSFGGNLLLGTGMKARLWHAPRHHVEWDAAAQYAWIGAPHKRQDNQGFWQEWQAATTLAKSFGRVTPYAGLKASLVRMRFTRRVGNTFVKSGTYHQRHAFGPVFGTDIALGEDRKTMLNLEASYIDGPELSLALSVLF